MAAKMKIAQARVELDLWPMLNSRRAFDIKLPLIMHSR
jgi:hypothetical protein